MTKKNNALKIIKGRIVKSAVFLAAFIFLFFANGYSLAAEQIDLKSKIENDKRLFSIEVRDALTSDVMRALAQQSGFNLILGDGVDGKVTLSFNDIVFKDAMEMILKASGLTYSIQNNVFWVGKKVDNSPDMVTEMVRMNYADPSSALTQIKSALSLNGTALVDARMNAIIIRDLPANIINAKKVLKTIDTQTTQVLIEARIVETSTSFSRQLGVQWGGEYASSRNSISGASALPMSTSISKNFAVNLPAPGATSGVGIVLGSLLSNKLLLDIQLSAAESRGDLKIVARPRIATVNNKSASIHSGMTIRVKLSQGLTVSTGGSTGGTSSGSSSGVQEIKTGIDLTVTPQISSDDFIQLMINTNKSDPNFSQQVDGIPSITEKSAQTNVIVKDGETVVIGGLYKTMKSEQNDSVPFLSDIPVLGYLFQSRTRNLQDEELLVFITPKIVRYESKEVAN
ncbi:type IV pilus secretin PilQ [bacterium]|nr:MAG: type IV pilus secretin PilQ [bacterium]